jgi:hypothetical protein
MLAGRMKLRNFVVLLFVVGVAGIGALVYACGKSDDKPKTDDKKPVASGDSDKMPAPTPTEKPPEPPPTSKPPTGNAESHDDLGPREHDAETIAWKDKSISSDKEKDVSKGKPYKISVYKDKGKDKVNRAKVDVNRNDKWDEKYSFDGEKVTLQRAPADDEKYTETYHWSGTGWIKEK